MNGSTVYLVWAKGTNRFKIGRSGNPQSRLLGMQTGSPFELALIAETDQATEADLHRQFADFAVKGEWFEVPTTHWSPLLSAFYVNTALLETLIESLIHLVKSSQYAIRQIDELQEIQNQSTWCLSYRLEDLQQQIGVLDAEQKQENRRLAEQIALWVKGGGNHAESA